MIRRWSYLQDSTGFPRDSISELSCLSINYSYENVLLRVQLNVNQTRFHTTGFAQGLVFEREAQTNSEIANFTMKLSVATDETVLWGLRAFPPRFLGNLFVINSPSALQPIQCQIPRDNALISPPTWCENPHLTYHWFYVAHRITDQRVRCPRYTLGMLAS